MQMLKRDIVVLDPLRAREAGVEVVDYVVTAHGGEPAEYLVVRAELVIDAGEILILIQDVGHRSDDIDVEDIFRCELRQRQVCVDEVLGIFINAAWRNPIRNIALGISKWFAGERIVDDGGRPNRNSITDERSEQRREVTIAEGLRVPECLLHGLLRFACSFEVETPERSVSTFVTRQQNRA